MRVKISANPPLPPVRAWFPLPSVPSTATISTFKSLLCASLPAFRDVSASTLRLTVDGFELLDDSELTVIRDSDLICVDVLEVPSQEVDTSARGRERGTSRTTTQRAEPVPSRKRKRRSSTPSSTSSESDTTESTTTTSESGSESESEVSTSESETTSGSEASSLPTTPSLQKAEPKKIDVKDRAPVAPSVQPRPHVVQPLVPPGYGKPQTRARNLRRRLKRTHEREASNVSQGGLVTGANTVVGGEDAPVQAVPLEPNQDAHASLLSLSLRNKNKAKNFRSLLNRPLAPKIIFGEQEGDQITSASGAVGTPEGTASLTRALPRLIPPSSRSSLPPNLFVTSVDVEAGMHRQKKKRKMHVEYEDELVEAEDVLLDYGGDTDEIAPQSEVERLEAIASRDWDTLEKLKNKEQVQCGMVIGYKGLAINPETCTPEECLTVGRVVSCDEEGVAVQLLRARDPVSFFGPVEETGPEEVWTGWAEIWGGDWRRVG